MKANGKVLHPQVNARDVAPQGRVNLYDFLDIPPFFLPVSHLLYGRSRK